MKFLSDILARAGLVVDGTVTLNSVANATTDTDRFIVVDSGVVKYRTGTQLLSDIGGISGNQTITLSGDATGSGTTSIAVTLANSGVTAGTYGSSTAVPVITVDAKGRVTGVTTASISGSLTFTGDVTGSGTTGSTTTLTLANSGVAAGTYTKVTVDAKGRVTSGTTISAGDVPTLNQNTTGSAGSLSDDSGYIRTRSGGAEANLDTYVDNGVRTIAFTGYGQHLLSWNVGSSPGTIQQLFHYNTPSNGWKIRNKTDNTTWSSWGYVVMSSSNQGLISGTIATQSWVQSQGYLTSVSDVWVNNSGDSMTGNLSFGSSGAGVTWSANTDGASITFESTGDGASGGRALSNLLIALTDNGDEGLKVTTTGAELLYVNTNQFQYKGNTIWHSANDGAGSGLDADLLDGIDSSRIIYGDNSTGTSSVSESSINGALKSGFYTIIRDGSGYMPNQNTGVNFYLRAAYYGIGNLAGMEFFTNDSTTSDLFYRNATGGGKGPWRTIWHSGNLTNLNQLTNGPGYITGYTETDTLASVTGRGASTSTSITAARFLQNAHSISLANGSYANESAVYANAAQTPADAYPGYGFHKSNVLGLFLYATNATTLRVRGDNGGDHLIYHSGNLTNLNQLTNGPGYITSYTETDTLATVTNRGNTTSQTLFVDQTTGGGYVFRTSSAWGGWARHAFSIADGSSNILSTIGGYGGSGTSISFMYIGKSYTDFSAAFNPDGNVEFRYDNSTRLTVDSVGISVSGRTTSGWGQFSSSTQGTPIVKAIQEDSTTGYYLFQGVTGSTEMFRVDRSGGAYFAGNVGVGVSSAANKLQIGSVGSSGYGGNDLAIGNGTQVMAFYQSSTVSTWYTNTNFSLMPSGSGATGNLAIGTTTASNRLTVSGNADITGNLGVGTASPSFKLQVNHSTTSQYVSSFRNTADNLQLKIGTSTGALLNIQGSTISSNAAYNICLQADGGNLGIGFSNPTTGDRVEIAGALRVHTGNNWDAIQIYTDGANGYIQGLGDETGLRIRSQYGNIILADDRANVAIGTTSPDGKLYVYQSATWSSGNMIGVNTTNAVTFSSAASLGTVAISAVGAGLALTYSGNATIGNSGRTGAIDAIITVGNGSAGTITLTQASTIRAMAGISSATYYNPSAATTITHLAGIRVLPDINTGAGAVTVTNKYGILIGDASGGTGSITYTNRWGIYQEGGSDNNYFAGKVMVGTTTVPTQLMYVNGTSYFNGNMTVNGTITELSTINIKTNVETLDGALDKVEKMRGVSYNRKDNHKKEIGFIAEEVDEVYPEFVEYDEQGNPVGLHYARLTAVLLQSVKELSSRIKELEKRN